jgi:3-oxoadipate enol-lactonase
MIAQANGIRMRYTLEGPSSAPVMTLSHALATNLAMWNPQMEMLASRFRVLRYDIRGHGGSDVPEGPYTVQQMAEDVASLLEVLEIDRTYFMGISMGGMIGQVLALNHSPKLTALILCDTTSRIPPEGRSVWEGRIRTAMTRGMEPHVEPSIEMWFTPLFRSRRPGILQRMRAMFRATSPKGYVGCCQAIQGLDITDRIRAITLPTLIIVGEHDPGTPVSDSETIHEQIRGSDLVVLSSASHLSNIEQPKAFNQAVVDFLSKIESGNR